MRPRPCDDSNNKSRKWHKHEKNTQAKLTFETLALLRVVNNAKLLLSRESSNVSAVLLICNKSVWVSCHIEEWCMIIFHQQRHCGQGTYDNGSKVSPPILSSTRRPCSSAAVSKPRRRTTQIWVMYYDSSVLALLWAILLFGLRARCWLLQLTRGKPHSFMHACMLCKYAFSMDFDIGLMAHDGYYLVCFYDELAS